MPTPTFIQPPYPWFYSYWQHFAQQTAAERLPHAILLKSDGGIGAGQLAVAMAQYLLCRQPADGLSCGQCRGCELMQADTHPDFLRLSPEEKSSVIKVAQVRALGDFVAQTALQGGRKIIIIEPAEAMNTEAANALLKNLEEPAGETVFILLSQQPARVLPTIRSRCSQTVLPKPTASESLAWLERNQVANAQILLEAANGAPVRALQWFEDNTLEQYQEIANLLQMAIQRSSAVVDVAKKLASYELLTVMELFQQWLHIAIKLAMLPAAKAQPSSYIPEPAQALAQLPVTGLYGLLDATQTRLAQLYSGSNPNKVLSYEEWLLMVQGVEAESGVRL